MTRPATIASDYDAAESGTSASWLSLKRPLRLHYCASNRPIRLQDDDGGDVTYFWWDGDHLYAEIAWAGHMVAQHSYYGGMDNPHAVIDGSLQIHYARRDGYGNVAALTDTNNDVKRTYEYDRFGALIDGGDQTQLNGKDRARFKGSLAFDEIGLQYMRNRSYDPGSGRFVSEDPIGLAGGVNQYAFAAGNPISGRDPTGLRCEETSSGALCIKPVVFVFDGPDWSSGIAWYLRIANSIDDGGSREGRQIVVTFAPTCPACLVTRPIWDKIAAEHPDIPFHAITTAHAVATTHRPGVGEFFESDGINIWQAETGDQIKDAVRSDLVPTTLVVGSSGVVLLARIGVLSDRDVTSIAKALSQRDRDSR